MLIVALIFVLPSAVVLVCGLGLSRVAADSDRASEQSARGVLLRLLARRAGDRRGWTDRRLLQESVEYERRLRFSERRRRDRRTDQIVVDPRP